MLNVQDIVFSLIHSGSAVSLLVRPFLHGVSSPDRPPGLALALLFIVSSRCLLGPLVGRGGLELALRIQIYWYPVERSLEGIALLERVLEPNGTVLLELDAHVDSVDADLGDDAPAVGRRAEVAIALVVALKLWLLVLLFLLQALSLLMKAAGVLLLVASAQQGGAGLRLLLRLEDVIVVALEGGVLVVD